MDATSQPQCCAVRHSARRITFGPRSLRTRRRKKRSPRGRVIREHEWESVHGRVKDCRRLNRTARAIVERGQNDRQRDQGHDAQQNFLHQSEPDGLVVIERRAIGPGGVHAHNQPVRRFLEIGMIGQPSKETSSTSPCMFKRRGLEGIS